jgi:predicted HicB family RNase H-like nuclease
MQLIEVKIRVPKEVHDVIKARAEKNDRSMNKEIINILKRQK